MRKEKKQNEEDGVPKQGDTEARHNSESSATNGQHEEMGEVEEGNEDCEKNGDDSEHEETSPRSNISASKRLDLGRVKLLRQAFERDSNNCQRKVNRDWEEERSVSSEGRSVVNKLKVSWDVEDSKTSDRKDTTKGTMTSKEKGGTMIFYEQLSQGFLVNFTKSSQETEDNGKDPMKEEEIAKDIQYPEEKKEEDVQEHENDSHVHKEEDADTQDEEEEEEEVEEESNCLSNKLVEGKVKGRKASKRNTLKFYEHLGRGSAQAMPTVPSKSSHEEELEGDSQHTKKASRYFSVLFQLRHT